jgi:DNA-binding NtrC family response regulator/tetratricopeptide (TPR) repeat protein
MPMAQLNPSPVGHPTDRLLGHSPAINALRAQIRHLAAFDTVGSPHAPTLLLQGETGTGKGLLARVIHDSGPRVHGPFIDINCAAIPETLLEAELFGFEAGAFTDAKRAKPGLLEAASGGTLFLDEIEALPLTLQSKFLKAIEEKWVRRLGAVRGQAVDVKIIAATTADLGEYAAAGRFRPDLYHRLAVVVVTLPPLRARAEDILLMAEHFLRRSAEAHGVHPNRLSGAAEAWLGRHCWPGNVRELSHLLERVTLLSREAIISPDTLESLCLRQPPAPVPAETTAGVDEPGGFEERTQLQAALRQTRGNVVQAARLLGLSRGALRHRLRRHGLQSPRLSAPSPAPSGDQPVMGTPAKHGAERAPERPTTPSAAWEHKPVAVLAIELTFPTTKAGETAAYEPWTATSRWEQALVAKVQGFGGVVLQCSPALLLVAFGIPHTLEQLPQRAVQAALALRHLVAEGADHAPRPALRLAMHWGEMLADVQASDPSAQLRALGETLAWPVRLLGQTVPGEILLSPEMGPLVQGWCEVRVREAPLQGGQQGPIRVYAVVGNRPPGPGWERQGWRPRSPFVGRDQELETLRQRLRQVEGGRGQVVGVIGDPGMGKSRLCDELVRGALAQPWLILHTQGTAYGQATPYLPIIDLLKGYFHIDGREEGATIRDQVSAHLHRLDDALTPTASGFLTLLEVPVEDPPWQALEAAQRRQRTLEALRWVLVRETQVQPVLLVCEDLHWIDVETQAFLDALVDSLPAARLLLLVNYRPEYRHTWGHKTAYTQLRLDSLPPASADALLQTLLGDDLTLAPLTTLLIERTEGNPFFLEESVQTLVETQGLVGARGAYRLAQALTSLQVPATVQAVLAARIDRLPAEAKRLLQTAAVIGQEIPFPLLHTLAERSEDALLRGLAHLQATEFLYETRLFPDRVYTFKHALTQQVAYETLPQERRRALHARLVDALAGDPMAAPVERLAHHALRGEVWEKAVSYGRQAGEKARNRGAAHEAVASFEQARDALGHLPESPDIGVLGIELHLSLGNMLSVAAGEHARSLALLGEAEARARRLDDRARLGGVLSRMVTVRWIVGDFQGALAAGREALELAARLGDPTLQAHAAYHVGQLYTLIGHHSRAAELLRGNVEALTRSTPGDMRLFCIKSQAWLAELLGLLGAFAEGRRHGEAALRRAMEDGPWHADAPIVVRARLGCLSLAQGNLDAAIRMFEEGLALSRTSGYRFSSGAILGGLGEAYAHTGRLAEGLALLEEARRDDLRTGALGGHYLTHLRQLSAVYLLASRFDEAWQHAYQALDLARQHGIRGNEALALCQLGAVHAQADPPDVTRSEAHYRQALALADDLGMRPLVAHCHLGLGKLYLKVGPLEQARSELSAALTLFRAMDMTFWLSQAEASLRQISG